MLFCIFLVGEGELGRISLFILVFNGLIYFSVLQKILEGKNVLKK